MAGTRRAPEFLRPATRRWWASVVAAWELEDHHIKLLTLAAQAWDRCEQARQEIERDGLTTPTRDGGRKRHPAVAIESECRIAFARLLRELDLDLDPPSAQSRPPMLRSIRARNDAA
jgi:P27 family predicted phage terminase small subunit